MGKNVAFGLGIAEAVDNFTGPVSRTGDVSDLHDLKDIKCIDRFSPPFISRGCVC